MSDEDRELSFDEPGTEWPLLALVREHGRGVLHYGIAGTVLLVTWEVVRQAPAALVGYMFDTVFSEGRAFELPVLASIVRPETRLDELYLAVALFVGIYLVNNVIRWLFNLAWGRFAYSIQHDLRTATYDDTQRLEMGFFDDVQTGEVMSVLNNDVNEMESFFKGTINSIISIPSYLAGIGLFMVLLNWQLALVTLAIAPVIAAANYWFSGIIERIHEDVRQAMGELNAQVQHSISGISVVKSYTAEDFEHERVEAASHEHFQRAMDAVRVRILHYPSMQFLVGLGLTATFGIGGYWVLVGPPGPFTEPLTAGALVTFLIYAQGIMWPMRKVTQIIDNFKSARASATRVLGLRNSGSGVPEPGEPIELEDVDGDVEYDGVTFAYGEDPALEDVTFSAEAGQTVGIVGSTGAGKSTILKLLLRYYDPDEGSITLDGHDLRELDLEDLRGSIGYISQEPFLFSGTIEANVAYGSPDADENDVVEALRRAGAMEFVEELPDGIETEIGERGVKLSGGQRQRLGLARVILRDSPILILDEATSHVDTETEALIQRRLESIVEDRTTFVVAHRLSTVRSADRIVVVDEGRVAEIGSHEELLERDGLYADLWRVQAGEVQSLPDDFFERIERRADAADLR